MNFLNHTPHSIALFADGIRIATFPVVGSIRLEEIDTEPVMETTDDGTQVPITVRRYGNSNLPPEEDGTGYIVSQLVCAAFPHREDFFYPAGDVRDGEGRIIGTTKLCQVPVADH